MHPLHPPTGADIQAGGGGVSAAEFAARNARNHGRGQRQACSAGA